MEYLIFEFIIGITFYRNMSKYLNGHLHYKTIPSQNVTSEAKVKNFFIS